MEFVSLFAGIGGFDLGLERAGLKCVCQVEIDKRCQGVLERHWPGVERYGDIKEFDASKFRGVDVVCGGFPCQDLSIAGKRKGLAGERSGLLWEALRVCRETGAHTIVIENVPGLLSSNKGGDMEAVVKALVELGYSVCWRVLDSQYFGVAQRRRRVFIAGTLGDGRSAEILFEPESLCRDSPPSREAGQGTTHPVTAGTLAASGAGMNRAAGMANEPDFCVVAGEGARRFTPTECSRLQGFPDDWNDHLSDTQRYKQFGNAVTVNVAEWIGRRIIGQDRSNS